MAESIDDFKDLQELGIDLSDSKGDKSFNDAANHLQNLVKQTKIDDEILLTLYGYYKQGLEGSCNSPKPSWYDYKGKAKWDSWNKLGNMTKEDARALYISTISSLDPDFASHETNEKNEPASESWNSVSTLQNNETLDEFSKTLIDFVKENNTEMVKSLLTNETRDLLDQDGLALIHWASDRGFLEVLQVLLDAGADVNAQDVDGQTALHYCASCGHLECIKLLLKYGANVNVADNDGMIPVDVANDDAVKKLLLENV